MGLIADNFRARIEEMRRRDEESMRELQAILQGLRSVADTMDEIVNGPSVIAHDQALTSQQHPRNHGHCNQKHRQH